MFSRNGLSIILFSLFFTALFHNEELGLNLLIFESLLLLWLLFSKQFYLKGLYSVSVGIGLFLSALFTVLTHSIFSYFMNFAVFFVFIGVLIYPKTKSIVFALAQAVSNLFTSPILLIQQLFSSKLKGKKVGDSLWKLRILLLPLFFIGLFLIIYSASNPIFNDLLNSIATKMHDALSYLFEDADLSIIFTFLIGLVLCIYIFYRSVEENFKRQDEEANEQLTRHRKKTMGNVGMLSLKNEFKAGIFLLTTLNLLLLTINIIDIKWVWFGFEWGGQYLKQFVHEGTYLLILSIFISIALVLYYFRNNLNFLKTNKWLKKLSYIWLIQNGVLSISVAIRNVYYIEHFALAYKRIGVFIFLMITMYGLYSVFIKVRNKRSSFYLFRTNSFFVLMVLLISSFINWDRVIANYNFKHSNESFLHLDFMSGLSDKTLDVLDQSLEILKQMDVTQKKQFPFEKEYMSVDAYHDTIEERKIAFKSNWESKGILSWNLPEYTTYKILFLNND